MCEKKRKPFTDESISKKLDKKVTEIRAGLNKLHFRGIACYSKSRNKNTGWYNYTWEINKERLAELILEKQEEEITKLSKKQSIEQDYHHFDCNECSERLPFEIATEYNFICPVCGGMLDSTNNPQKQKKIKSKISKIEKEIEYLKEKLY